MKTNGEIDLPDAPVECRLRRSSRATRLRLVVRPGLIEVVAPVGVSEEKALAFLEKHREWAESKALEFHQRQDARPPPTGFCDLPSIPWQGLERPLVIHEHDMRRVSVKAGESIEITLPQDLGSNRDRAAKKALYLWMKQWLAQQAKTVVGRQSQTMGVVVRQTRVKAMKTRWGSCGPRADINLNWLLALAPEPVLEYVVIHELCHLRERNHSPAFWALVAQFCPDHAQHRQWLRTHGPSLMQRFTVEA